MEKKLEKLLELLLEGVKKGADFASDQAPHLINEILWWGAGSNMFTILLSVIAFISVWKVSLWLHTEYKKAKYGQEYEGWVWEIHEYNHIPDSIFPSGGTIPIIACGVVIAIVSISSFLASAYNLIQIWLAPRLYLIEYIKDFL